MARNFADTGRKYSQRTSKNDFKRSVSDILHSRSQAELDEQLELKGEFLDSIEWEQPIERYSYDLED